MRKHKKHKVMLALTLLIGSQLLLFGCGGGGSGVTTPMGNSGNTGANGMISGTAVKGPVSGATVTAFAVNNGTMGMKLASGTTDSQGNFNISIGDYAGPIMVEMSGGTYVDEATGATVNMASGAVMTAVMTSVPAGMTVTGIQITPLTSMAQAMADNMAGGMTDANITAANAAMGNYFMVNDILHTQPMNPLVSGSSGTATQDMKNYGMAIAAMSQSAKDMGMTSSSSMVTAMMNDASDGVMNGMMGSTPVMMGGMMTGSSVMATTAGTSGLATEMSTFITSTLNKSGVTATDMQALMNQLTSSATGTIQSGGGTPMNGMIGGSVFNGTMSNATVMAYAVSGGTMGAQMASATTNSTGSFSMSLGAYSGPVMLKMSGGSYTNLATSTTMTMSAGDVMTAVIPTMASGATVTGIQMTPLTSMAQARAQAMAGGMTDANIAAANTAVGNYFMVSDILRTQPMNAAVSGSGGTAITDMRNYGIAIAAMSQYAQTIGMADPAALISDMMQDASDGIMNGMMGSTSITMGGMGGGMMGGGGTMMQSTAGTSGLATAMTTFMGSATNKSGLSSTDMQTLINKLNTSNGTIQ
ncbi:MAG TPA: hypothetical protein VF905_02315 [Nitrospirota bacterium]